MWFLILQGSQTMSEIDFAAETKALIDGVADCKHGMGPGCHCIQDIDARLRSIAQRVQEETAASKDRDWIHAIATGTEESEIRADERRKVAMEWATGLCSAHQEPVPDCRICNAKFHDAAIRENERRKWAERMEAKAEVYEFQELAPYRASYLRVWAKRLRENS